MSEEKKKKKCVQCKNCTCGKDNPVTKKKEDGIIETRDETSKLLQG